MACKAFDSLGVTKLVQLAMLGSPNPYMWNEDAVHCAVLRRQILTDLVEYWFGSKLCVANALDYRWCDEARAFEMRTLYSRGRPLPLHHPMRTRGSGLLTELTKEVMKPLQKLLIDSGFDGLVWQAGKGNPVALNNFLLEDRTEHEKERSWVWIDLESGVPALFPLSPLALCGFYMPCSLRLGRPLFDDIDMERLHAYLDEHRALLEVRLGSKRTSAMRENARLCEARQRSWKNMPRHHRSIGYRRARDEINEEQASWYRARPLHWYGREMRRAFPRVLGKLLGLPVLALAQLTRIPWRTIPRTTGNFLISQRFRARISRLFVARRIRAWLVRDQIDVAQAKQLRSHLASEESTSYLTDFGVHIAIKPAVKVIEFWILPALFGIGWISGTTLAIGLLTGGPIARSLYTGGRLIQSTLTKREKPWVALGVGVIPMLGNLAYPLQIIYASTEQEDDLARFILYDGCARIGKHVPIWGGADTHTEHFFNRLPDVLANLRQSPQDDRLQRQPES